MGEVSRPTSVGAYVDVQRTRDTLSRTELSPIADNIGGVPTFSLRPWGPRRCFLESWNHRLARRRTRDNVPVLRVLSCSGFESVDGPLLPGILESQTCQETSVLPGISEPQTCQEAQ